jgi:hypothetical protein
MAESPIRHRRICAGIKRAISEGFSVWGQLNSGSYSETRYRRKIKSARRRRRMAQPVSKIAHRHTTDIYPEKQVDAPRLESLVYVCIARARKTLDGAPAGYSEVQRFVLAEILSSMKITHGTIKTILKDNTGKPESVDTLSLARVQLEGLYVFCLMLEDPSYIDIYLKDGWKKRYITILLETEEHKALPRFDEFLNTLAPKFFAEGRAHYGITEVQQLTRPRLTSPGNGSPIDNGAVR